MIQKYIMQIIMLLALFTTQSSYGNTDNIEDKKHFDIIK
jgi:hypothetical protein